MSNPSEQSESIMIRQQSRRRFKRIGVVTLVFIAGMVSGGMLTARLIHWRINEYRAHPAILVEAIVTRLQSRLDLSTDERVCVRDIISHRNTRMTESRNKSVREINLEFDEMEQDIAAVLDSERAAAWHQIASSVRSHYLPMQSN